MAELPASIRLGVTCSEAQDMDNFPAIDIFPHRVQCHENISAEDILIYLACVSMRFHGTGRWSNLFDPHYINQIMMNGLQAPFVTIAPGGVVTALDDDLSGDLILTAAPPDFTLSDGRSLHPALYRDMPFYTRRLEMPAVNDETLTSDCPRMQVMLALILEALPANIEDMKLVEERLTATFGRVVRLLDLGYTSGAAGSDAAARDIHSLLSRLREDWKVRPDHIHSPDKLIASEEMRRTCSHIPEAVHATARAALKITDNRDLDGLGRASRAKKGAQTGNSMHDELRLRHAIKSLDAAIEGAAPLEMLKPGARKRQAKLRDAN